jgi:hydrogenase 3 maturation protease
MSRPTESASRRSTAVRTGWQAAFRARIAADYLLIGAGNDLMGDDGAGPAVARGLRKRGVKRALDVGNCPENYLGRIRRWSPRHLVVVDACDIGREPGSVALRAADDFTGQGASTHAAGMQPLSAYLSRTCTARRWVLAVQPVEVSFGAPMSGPVRRAVRRIVASPVWKGGASADAG